MSKIQSIPAEAVRPALIYVRVSTERQVAEGHGIESQEQRCRAYAASKKYPVEKVFQHEGISGGLFERPAIQALLQYMDDNPHKKYVVIIDDLSRLARGLQVHLKLKTEIIGRSAILDCPNFNFDESPEGELIENIMASQSQYFRQQNRRQVIQKMKARLEAGYWPFAPIPGFSMNRDVVHGKLLTAKEPYASIFKEGMEKFADGYFLTIQEFRNFIILKFKELGINKKLTATAAKNILREVLYAGYIEYPEWGVTLREGRHKGIITLDTYNRVQDQLNGNTRPRKRKDYNVDFPLRGHIVCSACGGKLTASWSKGRNKYYGNYCCITKGCPLRYKSIGKSKIDSEFERMLNSAKPCKEVLDLAKEVFLEQWEEKLSLQSSQEQARQDQIKEVEATISAYFSRIGKTKDEFLVRAYEQEIAKLTADLDAVKSTKTKTSYTAEDFGTASNLVITALNNPMIMWKSEDYSDKKSILLMYFDDFLQYDFEKGLGTVTLTTPLYLIKSLENNCSYYVHREGFEPS